MSIALRNRQMLALIIVLAIITVLVLTLVVASAVMHTDVWHLMHTFGSVGKLVPEASFPH